MAACFHHDTLSWRPHRPASAAPPPKTKKPFNGQDDGNLSKTAVAVASPSRHLRELLLVALIRATRS